MSDLDPMLLKHEFDRMTAVRHVGLVSGVAQGLIEISGLNSHARIGDLLTLQRRSGPDVSGEVLHVDADHVHMMPGAAPDGVSLGDRVYLDPSPGFAPGLHWLGRVIDPFGKPLDGKPLLNGAQDRDIMQAPPPAVTRKPLGERMATGLSVLNTMLPIVRGQRVGLFAGSGVGKSTLLSTLARSMRADAVVVALIGERGREVNEFVAHAIGPEAMQRTIVVAATSDQSALSRRRCAWSAMSTAEFLRDQGLNVLFLADSVTRFAEAHREIAVAMGETPSLRGYPPSVTPLIANLCERAGPGAQDQGYITAVFSVLVAGSDMDEPVADILRGVLDGHIVLSRDIAERGRFPAIDLSRSVSRSLPGAASEAENHMISETRRLVGSYEQSEVMIKAGLYAEGSDPLLDQAVRVHDELDSFFGKPDSEGIENSFSRLSLILRRASVGVPR
ncbi:MULTISPECIES: FliI/YscN family ATPase [unclassified Ruegeria]|uniref:FliI/YscN family ATPase n=2 Tax=Ruegeria TaxID=97050 RepID=UPI0014924B97|nr:FliI/YscN family ATPase [Ruegeria sp. HKCCD5849]NOD53363.1 FliI/YscN family ATPase [Ruegeria sp. HKCCD5851]NOD69687.1 FliI/YscN family ATPase [Ruegeria sp. HKCCD7303]